MERIKRLLQPPEDELVTTTIKTGIPAVKPLLESLVSNSSASTNDSKNMEDPLKQLMQQTNEPAEQPPAEASTVPAAVRIADEHKAYLSYATQQLIADREKLEQAERQIEQLRMMAENLQQRYEQVLISTQHYTQFLYDMYKQSPTTHQLDVNSGVFIPAERT